MITGLYALLTHAQPFWADSHALIVGFLGGATELGEKQIEAVDPEVARAVCAMLLATLFSGRAVKNFGGLTSPKIEIEKKKGMECHLTSVSDVDYSGDLQL